MDGLMRLNVGVCLGSWDGSGGRVVRQSVACVSGVWVFCPPELRYFTVAPGDLSCGSMPCPSKLVNLEACSSSTTTHHCYQTHTSTFTLIPSCSTISSFVPHTCPYLVLLMAQRDCATKLDHAAISSRTTIHCTAARRETMPEAVHRNHS